MRSAAAILAFSAVLATATAVSIGHGSHDTFAYPAYKSEYAVADKHTGDQKSASEVRDGGITRGSYSLVQPDGVVRTVNYIVTPHGGFQAQVVNKGVAAHPAIGKGWGSGLGGLGGSGIGGGGRSVIGGLGAPIGVGLGVVG